MSPWWAAPEILPSGPIGLHPFAHVFHYAIEVSRPPAPAARQSFVLPSLNQQCSHMLCACVDAMRRAGYCGGRGNEGSKG